MAPASPCSPRASWPASCASNSSSCEPSGPTRGAGPGAGIKRCRRGPRGQVDGGVGAAVEGGVVVALVGGVVAGAVVPVESGGRVVDDPEPEPPVLDDGTDDDDEEVGVVVDVVVDVELWPLPRMSL